MDELTKSLRICSQPDVNCGECEMYKQDKKCGAGRLLMAEAADAIEELQKALDAVNDAHNEGYDVGYWAGRRDYEPKWISVAERLPEENGRYLVLYPLKTKPSVWWHEVYGFAKDLVEVDKYEFDEHKPGFYGYHDECGYYEKKNVTHWMPLPEPPKDGES